MDVRHLESLKPKRSDVLYEFGPYVVDVAKSVLLRNDEVVPLGLKAFEVLLVLIQHHGQVVMKDELLSQVWPDTVVEENNLARTISALRKALGESLGAPQFIATIPGRGYRFVADVQEVEHVSEPVHLPWQPRSNGHSTARDLNSPNVPAIAAFADERLTKQLRYYKLALGAVLFLLIAGIMAALVVPQLRQPAQVSLPRKLWQLSFDPGLESEPTWSPDGRLIAYSSDRSGNFDIWVQPVGEGQPVRVTTSTAHDWQADWAPEGNRLVFRSERDGGGLYVVPVLGGNEHKIASFGYRPRWSPDGTQILFYSSILRTNTAEIPKLYLVGLDGKPPREVLTDFLTGFKSFCAAWHPDGQRLSLWGNHLKQGNGFWTIPLAGGAPIKSEFTVAAAQQLKESGVYFSGFQWASDAAALYFEGVSASVKSIWKVAVETTSLRWIAGPERLTAGAGLDTDVALSRNGRNVAFTSRIEQTRLWSFPFNAATGKLGNAGQPITTAGTDAYFPDLSADGRKLVFVTNRAGKRELRVKSLADGSETILITDDLSRSSPRWSRDGKRLAYSRENTAKSVSAQNRWDIATLPVAGGDEQVLTTAGPLVEPTWDWSTDGTRILVGFMRSTPVRRLIGTIPVSAAPHAEAQMHVVTSHPDENLYQARFSPDDRWISFCTAKMNQAGISTIYVVPAAGGEWTRLTEGHSFDDKPRWSPDGRMLYFISNRTGFFNVWGIRFDPVTGQPVGAPFRVTPFDSPSQMILEDVRIMELALAADRLVLPLMEVTGNLWILENVGQ
ncbi:MAG: PD40 domain-containing protein [Acidobacteria bacterium]|nr:PD40 domain-containing protein [Acidobacteriota bacterium]MBI3428399.1 PD40 domain-containing protein [Acidobacteriota bacterium]